MARTARRARWTSKQARREPFIPVMRELVRAYQAFERCDAAPLRDRGLTVSQADVIFTLGNTPGMTFKDLGARTLITKGTLTGVVDRLERKKLVRRQPSPVDGRSTIVVLTARGHDLFERTYPEHIAYLKERFDQLGATGLERTHAALRRLTSLFD